MARRSCSCRAPDIDARLRENAEWSEHLAPLAEPVSREHRPHLSPRDCRVRQLIWLSDLAVLALIVFLTFF